MLVRYVIFDVLFVYIMSGNNLSKLVFSILFHMFRLNCIVLGESLFPLKIVDIHVMFWNKTKVLFQNMAWTFVLNMIIMPFDIIDLYHFLQPDIRRSFVFDSTQFSALALASF